MNQLEIDELRARPVKPRQHFINGAWVNGLEGATIDVISPIDGKGFTALPLGGFRQSGFGRDKSLHAFDAYTNLKTAWIALS